MILDPLEGFERFHLSNSADAFGSKALMDLTERDLLVVGALGEEV